MYYIIRHGQTETNKKKALQGRSDLPLNDEGRRQAKMLRDYFEREGITFDAVYSSPLGRALETARIVTGGAVEPVIDERIIEMDYGPYEGMTLEKPPKEILRFFSDFVNEPAPEGMEPLDEVQARMGDFVDSIKGEGAGERNVLISTHAIAMKGALEHLSPDSKGSYWSKYVANCALYVWDENDEGFGIPEEIKYREEDENRY